MRPASPTKILTFETHRQARDRSRPKLSRPDLSRPDLSRPDISRPDIARLRRGSIETALEVEFRGVENLLRSMEDLAFYWTLRRPRP
jgi:hypothetical protein